MATPIGKKNKEMQRVHVEVKVRQRQGFTRFQHKMAMAVQFVCSVLNQTSCYGNIVLFGSIFDNCCCCNLQISFS